MSTMKTLFLAFVVTLVMKGCLIPSMASTAQTYDLASLPHPVVAMVSAMHVNIDVVTAWGRRRRRWLYYGNRE